MACVACAELAQKACASNQCHGGDKSTTQERWAKALPESPQWLKSCEVCMICPLKQLMNHDRVQNERRQEGGGHPPPSDGTGRHVVTKRHLIASEPGWTAQLCVQVSTSANSLQLSSFFCSLNQYSWRRRGRTSCPITTALLAWASAATEHFCQNALTVLDCFGISAMLGTPDHHC